MGYKVVRIQNRSDWSKEYPSIIIDNTNPQWADAYKKWLCGQLPSDDPEWKHGVFAITALIENGS